MLSATITAKIRRDQKNSSGHKKGTKLHKKKDSRKEKYLLLTRNLELSVPGGIPFVFALRKKGKENSCPSPIWLVGDAPVVLLEKPHHVVGKSSTT